ncbi:hypothetical protein HPG69_007228, partial [Diceros bicornis minor]
MGLDSTSTETHISSRKDPAGSCGQRTRCRPCFLAPRTAPSSQKTHPCETCGPVLRDIFYLAEQQGTQHSLKLLRCGACAKQFDFTAKEALSLGGAWEGLPGQLGTSAATDHSYCGEAKQNHPVQDAFTRQK